ncbi:molybdopterin-guanine dinucleotide biosynthesis protein B [Sulfurisphaera javensis]|uniref:Molybdopterin-guanine dinucleotide biosynthesis protein B n=1 Tax=Sulfurisphaera javensis TaxID=2049879 RepID=A0AAT9GNI1_9CREN
MPCIIQVIGKKDTGKTSAIEKAVKILKENGYTVAVVKHSHHEIDLQGKDTYKFWNAGSDIVTFNNSKCVLFYKCNPDLIHFLPVDVVLIEGYKELDLGKKIEISNPNQVDEVSKRIIEETKNCKTKGKIIVDGKKIECNDTITLLLYNLLRYLNIREVKIED